MQDNLNENLKKSEFINRDQKRLISLEAKNMKETDLSSKK